MSYRYHSRRSVKRLAAKSKRNFLFTLVIVALLMYASLFWVFPFFVNSVGEIKNTLNPPKKNNTQSTQNTTLAPPVLNILFEATNSAQIDINGYGTPDSKVRLYLDDEEKQETNVSSDGTFNFEKVSLNLGTNNIYGKTVDENNKESLPSKTIKLSYLNEKPNLDISEPNDNKTIQGGDKKVKVVGKTNPGVRVFVNNSQVVVDQNGNFSQEFPLNDGDNIFTIKAVDAATNSTEIQRKVVYNP